MSMCIPHQFYALVRFHTRFNINNTFQVAIRMRSSTETAEGVSQTQGTKLELMSSYSIVSTLGAHVCSPWGGQNRNFYAPYIRYSLRFSIQYSISDVLTRVGHEG